MSDTFTIAVVQMPCEETPPANIQRTVSAIEKAAAQGAQVICLQELFNSRYFCSREDASLFSVAEPIPGPTVERMQDLARKLGVALVVPLFEKRAPGVYHNSAAVVDADGTLLGVYRKMHIPDDPLYYEKFYFTPGDTAGEHCGFQVFETKYARIGVLICWDQWYPEAARITALLGAEVLFYPTAIGWHPQEKEAHGEDQWNAWETMQRAHAVANGVFVAAANRTGFEPTPGTDGLEFFGRSFICDPFGKVICRAADNEEAVLTAVCERKRLEEVRTNWPFFRDRRIDAYSPILKRWAGKE